MDYIEPLGVGCFIWISAPQKQLVQHTTVCYPCLTMGALGNLWQDIIRYGGTAVGTLIFADGSYTHKSNV